MGMVSIWKTQWDSGTNSQTGVLRFAAKNVELGVPALYSDGVRDVYIFHSASFVVEDAAYLGSAAKLWMQYRNRPLPDGSVEAREAVRSDLVGRIVPVDDVALTEIVQVEVPVRIQVEVEITDENGDPTGETVLVWQDHPTDTRMVDVEQSLGDPYRLVLDAQVGVPPWISCFSAVPDSWMPVQEVN